MSLITICPFAHAMSKKGAWQWKLLHFLGNRRRPKTSEKVHEKDRKRKKKKMDLTVRGRNLEKVIFEELCDNSNDDL